MSGKTKVTIGVVLVLLLCSAGFYAVHHVGTGGLGGGRDDDASETAAVEETDAARRERERVQTPADTAGADPAEEATAETVEETVTPEAPESITTAESRVTVVRARILRFLPPRAVPKGYTEIRSNDDIPEIKYGGDVRGPRGPTRLPYWQRWPNAPEVGTVTLRGEVRDAAGVPLEGAKVLRIEPDESGSRASPCSYQFIKKIAETDRDGRFEAKQQMAGAFLLAAEYHGMLNRPGGLDIATALTVTAAEDQTVDRLAIRLPIETARIATIEGLLVDPDGKPLKGEAWVGRLRREWVRKDGRFAFDALQPGDHTLSFSSTGYARKTMTVTLQPGETRELRVELEMAEQGDLALEGRVVDRSGAGVASARVFLGASRYGSRWATADDSGTFVFDNLPRKYEEITVDVMVSPHPERDMYIGNVLKGITIPYPGLELVVDRLAPLYLTVTDAETGEPVPALNVELSWEYVVDGETKQRRIGGAWKWSEDGTADLRAGLGRNILTVRAQGHRAVEAEVIVESLTDPLVVKIELPPEL